LVISENIGPLSINVLTIKSILRGSLSVYFQQGASSHKNRIFFVDNMRLILVTEEK